MCVFFFYKLIIFQDRATEGQSLAGVNEDKLRTGDYK